MSDFFFIRARRMRLKVPEPTKELVDLVENLAGVIGSISCDRVMAKMSDQEFLELYRRVFEEWERKKKRKVIEAIA